jgi:hypothetical protein
MLASVANLLSPEKKKAFLEMLENSKTSEPWKTLLAQIGGLYGADKRA